MALLRTLVFYTVFYVGSVPLVVLALFESMLGPVACLRGARRWASYHYWCARHLLGITVRIVGVLPQSGVIIALKHESAFETIETLRLFDRPAVVFKAELLKIPIWGPTARRHGVIPVAREAGSVALRQMLAAARRAVADGRPIIIFPEGTRVPHGFRAPIKPGVAGLYKSLKLPIVPIAINSGRLWPRNRFVKDSGVITFQVGDPIPPGLDRDVIESRIVDGINVINIDA